MVWVLFVICFVVRCFGMIRVFMVAFYFVSIMFEEEVRNFGCLVILLVGFDVSGLVCLVCVFCCSRFWGFYLVWVVICWITVLLVLSNVYIISDGLYWFCWSWTYCTCFV